MQIQCREALRLHYLAESFIRVCGAGDCITIVITKPRTSLTYWQAANLYYAQTILNVLAVEFHVSYDDIAIIPTTTQAGYCIGVFFLCPLGDLVRRRAFVLLLIGFTATVW